MFLAVEMPFLFLAPSLGWQVNSGTSLDAGGLWKRASWSASRGPILHRDCSIRKQAATAGYVVLSASVAFHSLRSSCIYKTALIVLSCNYIWRQETVSFDSSSPNAFKLPS